MASKLALEKAAQVWCRPECEKKVMDVVLAEAFAEVLDEVWSQPSLGNATTRELLEEIKARIEIDGNLDYKTVDTNAEPFLENRADDERAEPAS